VLGGLLATAGAGVALAVAAVVPAGISVVQPSQAPAGML
jgi:hypothetical protein